ncbi:RNA polymerase sigma factor [Pedobacter cryophilus]|uniref:Sigma-70 family RNA polymerase sigma factor n=1 Tax=Pedobacter cryophilus TaxID=2571271 RepID=A0A4U1C6L8_9SPHI|nr:sigma-70 family RNA polymerase sigma factor [Pedobacter cryophilus]TKC01123.1 sigma-70 family RNA polymerase sigma factor [Pedobacter cryophilus]
MELISKNIEPISLDEQLITDYKKSGDLLVLGKLYEQYMPLVYGVCLKYFKDEEESKDAVMQIFEELIHKLKLHEVKNFKSWLYVLSRNYCLMELRKSQKHTMVNIEDQFMELESSQHHEDSNQKEWYLTAMEKCMETLSDEQKISVNLFYLQQQCYTEVAQNTGFELNKVKSYIQNGKRNLKICIEKQGE